MNKNEIAAKILPAIKAAFEGDEELFFSPVSGETYDIVARHEVDIDVDNPEGFTVGVIRNNSWASSQKVMTRDNAYDAVADMVADELIAAKAKLLGACAELGLSKAA
jgi:hypothetical protein